MSHVTSMFMSLEQLSLTATSIINAVGNFEVYLLERNHGRSQTVGLRELPVAVTSKRGDLGSRPDHADRHETTVTSRRCCNRACTFSSAMVRGGSYNSIR